MPIYTGSFSDQSDIGVKLMKTNNTSTADNEFLSVSLKSKAASLRDSFSSQKDSLQEHK